jgi:hypothetical protein
LLYSFARARSPVGLSGLSANIRSKYSILSSTVSLLSAVEWVSIGRCEAG